MRMLQITSVIAMIIVKTCRSSSLVSLQIFPAFPFWRLLLLANLNGVGSAVHFFLLLLVTPAHIVHLHT